MFTAFPPTGFEDEPTTTKRKPPTAGIPQSRPANQTMVFGTGAAAEAPAPPANRPANQTMVFGTGPAQQPPAAGKPSQTMVFGAQPSVPAPAAQRPANQTMVFGTPAGQQSAQPAPAPSQSAGAANQTLVFGASPVAPPAGPSQTMVFGTAAGQQAAAREPPPRAPPAANQTLVFGAKPPPAQALNQTMAFGTPAGQQLATGAPQAPAAAPNQTLVFGASPQAPAKGPAATMVFGTAAAQPPPSGANRPVNQTMMFGKPPETTPVASKTMAFGTPVAIPPKRPLPKVTAGGDDVDSESEPRAESTVRVDLERMMREHGEGAEGNADDGESIEQRHDRTQRFAMSEEAPIEAAITPGDGSESVQDRHNRTALFAMSTLQETTKPDAKAPSLDKHSREPTVSVEGAQTLPPDGYGTLPPNSDIGSLMGLDPHGDPPGVSTLMEPGGDISMHGTIRNDGPIASTMPNLPPIGHDATNVAHRGALRLDLVSGPDLGTVSTAPDRPMLQVDLPGDAAAVEALASQGRRRNVLAIVVVLLIVLAVALGVAWQFFGKALLSSKVDPESQQTVVQALQHFQQEDAAVREADLARLQSLVRTNTTFTDGHAALVLGLTLQIDDLRGQHAALVATHARLVSQHAALKDDPKKEAATQAVGRRINALVEKATTLKTKIDESWARLDSAVKGMDAAVAAGAPAAQSQRARVFVAAQQGRAEVDANTESSDYWLQLAAPLAALNAAKQSPAELKEALAQVEAMKATFNDLPRPHFVAARLYVALGENEKAIPELDLAVARAANFKAAIETKKTLDEK